MPLVPQTTKVMPPKTIGGKPAVPSVLARAVKLNTLPMPNVSLLLFGPNRVGKTTLACQFPKPLLYIDCEPGDDGGYESVRHIEGIDYLRVTNPDELITLGYELQDANPYATVLLETADSVQDAVLRKIKGVEDKPLSMRWGMVNDGEYQDRSEKSREILYLYLRLKCHRIITSIEKDHRKYTDVKTMRRSKLTNYETPESYFAPAIGDANALFLQNACNWVMRMHMVDEEVENRKMLTISGKTEEKVTYEKTGKSVPRLELKASDTWAGGCRYGNPDGIPDYIDNPTWEKLEAVLRKTPKGDE